MRRAFVTAVLAAAIAVVPAPAFADRGDRYDQRDGCGEQGGGCNNRREEDYTNGRKYSPSFEDSPVYFAPAVCLPGSTCHFERRDEPPAQGSGG